MSVPSRPCRLCVHYRRRKPSDQYKPRSYGWCALADYATHANQTSCRSWLGDSELIKVEPKTHRITELGGELTKALAEVARLRELAEAVCNTSVEAGDWIIQVEGERFNALDEYLQKARRRG